MNVNEGDVLADFTLAAGDTADFILSYVDKISPNVEDIKSFVDRTLMEEINYWKNWIEQSNYQGRWRETVNRSALILKLMTSYEYGSLVAALTFGLPEEIGGERNWDYRYTWIRDASFTVYCLLNLGYTEEAGNFIDWVENKCFDVSNKETLHLMYTHQLAGRQQKFIQQLEAALIRIANKTYGIAIPQENLYRKKGYNLLQLPNLNLP